MHSVSEGRQNVWLRCKTNSGEMFMRGISIVYFLRGGFREIYAYAKNRCRAGFLFWNINDELCKVCARVYTNTSFYQKIMLILYAFVEYELGNVK